MDLMKPVRNIARWMTRATPENPSFSLTDPEAWDAFGAKKSATGVSVTRTTALSYDAVWRAVNLISGDVAKLPLMLYERNGEGKDRATTHPAYQLIRHKPNEYMTAFTFKQTLTAHAMLQRGGFAYIFRGGDGRPVELLPLIPDHTYPVRENGVLWYVTQVGGTLRKLRPEDVLHIKGLSYDGLDGYIVLDMGRESIGGAIASRDYGSTFFKNGAKPSVVLEHPGKISKEAVEDLRKSWDRIHAGLENSHKIAILEQGMKLHAFSMNAKDAQLIENRKFSLVEIANLFGVPPHKLGDTARTSYASLEQENQSYLDDALDPWLVRWEEECRDKLLSEQEKKNDSHIVEFTRQALVRADINARYSAYAIAIQNRIMSPNEVRARENMNPYDGGDDFLVPLNIGNPGGEPGATKEEPKEPMEPPADPPPVEEDDERAKAHRELMVETLTRMVKRVGTAARRAAKKPDDFCDWIEGYRDDVLEDMIDPVLRCRPPSELVQPVTAKQFCSLLLELIKKRLMEATGAKPDELSRVIDEAMSELEKTLPPKMETRAVNKETNEN